MPVAVVDPVPPLAVGRASPERPMLRLPLVVMGPPPVSKKGFDVVRFTEVTVPVPGDGGVYPVVGPADVRLMVASHSLAMRASAEALLFALNWKKSPGCKITVVEAQQMAPPGAPAAAKGFPSLFTSTQNKDCPFRKVAVIARSESI